MTVTNGCERTSVPAAVSVEVTPIGELSSFHKD